MFKQSIFGAIALIALVNPTLAEPARDIRPTGKPLVIQAGSGTLLELSGPIGNVFISNPDIVSTQVPTEQGRRDLVYIFAKKSGSTALYVLDQDGQVILTKTVDVPSREVRVVRGGKTSTWTPELGDSSSNSSPSGGSLSDLPAGSSVNIPIGTK